MEYNTKHYFDYQGGRYSVRQLIDLIDFPFELDTQGLRDMGSRMRYHIKQHGVDKAMEIMKKAKKPVSRAEWREAVAKSKNPGLDTFDPNLEQQRIIQNLRDKGADDEEIIIKLRHSYAFQQLQGFRQHA